MKQYFRINIHLKQCRNRGSSQSFDITVFLKGFALIIIEHKKNQIILCIVITVSRSTWMTNNNE